MCPDIYSKYEMQLQKSYLQTCVPSEDSDQPGHSRSLISSFTLHILDSPLQKHAYSNILKILQPNKENFQIKHSDIFHIPALNIDCGYSLEPPQ